MLYRIVEADAGRLQSRSEYKTIQTSPKPNCAAGIVDEIKRNLVITIQPVACVPFGVTAQTRTSRRKRVGLLDGVSDDCQPACSWAYHSCPSCNWEESGEKCHNSPCDTADFMMEPGTSTASDLTSQQIYRISCS
ncbi:unnamed protein product [Protopolystoma xenopodis]|uniref:Uncharacterized protein n=1 Tax=Protopolystoma xenopodis TaxID=117903 RepID=A0A3S5B1S4_9PLAT|nr:unnamed protein product [Protopolystoma xenopodis]